MTIKLKKNPKISWKNSKLKQKTQNSRKKLKAREDFPSPCLPSGVEKKSLGPSATHVTVSCPCLSAVPETMHEARLRAFESYSAPVFMSSVAHLGPSRRISMASERRLLIWSLWASMKVSKTTWSEKFFFKYARQSLTMSWTCK